MSRQIEQVKQIADESKIRTSEAAYSPYPMSFDDLSETSKSSQAVKGKKNASGIKPFIPNVNYFNVFDHVY